MRVNVYTPTQARLWLRFASEEDLEPSACHDEEIGDVPSWLDYEMSESGLSVILDEVDWATFALSLGIAPDQPFMLELERPHYYKTWTDCGYEHDVDYNWDIALVEPLAEADAVNRWATWLALWDD